jgi:hypothetical protein
MNSTYSTGFHAQFPSPSLFSPPWAPVVISHKLFIAKSHPYFWTLSQVGDLSFQSYFLTDWGTWKTTIFILLSFQFLVNGTIVHFGAQLESQGSSWEALSISFNVPLVNMGDYYFHCFYKIRKCGNGIFGPQSIAVKPRTHNQIDWACQENRVWMNMTGLSTINEGIR